VNATLSLPFASDEKVNAARKKKAPFLPEKGL
jgi:hypothetical protein